MKNTMAVDPATVTLFNAAELGEEDGDSPGAAAIDRGTAIDREKERDYYRLSCGHGAPNKQKKNINACYDLW